MNLTDESTEAIANNDPRRLFSNASLGLRGSFDNLPADVNFLVNNYPEIQTTRKPRGYLIRGTGELDINIHLDHKARLPEGTTFNAKSFVLIGEEYSGIYPTKAEIQDK